MHIDLMRDKSTDFPHIASKNEVRSLRIWHCKYKSLQAIADFHNLEELVIASFPEKTLEMVLLLPNLRYLSILHMPKVSNLDALEKLDNLDILSLSTSPSWDAGRKCSFVNSLEPIARMKNIKHLELFGVCPVDKSLAILEQCKKLRSARFSQYPALEIERFYKVTGIVDKGNPPPSFEKM